jgi:hypothetical protein
MNLFPGPRCNGAVKGLSLPIDEEMKGVLDRLMDIYREQRNHIFYTSIDVPGIIQQINITNDTINSMVQSVKTWFSQTELLRQGTRPCDGVGCGCEQCVFHSAVETIFEYEDMEEIVLYGDLNTQGGLMRMSLEITLNSGYHMYECVRTLERRYNEMMLNGNAGGGIADAVIDQHESDDLSSPFETPNRYAALVGLSD